MLKIAVILMMILLYALAVEGSNLKMPSFSFIGESVRMECNIDHGDLSIISITWSKDGEQFYKYDPNQTDPVTVINIPGVEVKKDLSLNGNSITIGSVTLESAGLYKCIVHIDHPSLDVGEMSGFLKVVRN